MTYHTAREIVIALKGRYSGNQGFCLCPAHAEKTPSLHVTRCMDGRVLVYCHGGCSNDAVIAALKSRGLWGDGEYIDAPACVRVESTLYKQEAHEKRDRAKTIWDEKSKPAKGTHVEAYLRARGIKIPISPELRFAVLPYHSENESRRLAKSYPCMVARISDNRGFCAVQRTYLDPNLPRKADVQMAKKTLGPMGKGAVRLGEPRETLGLAEGIETALSARKLYAQPVWATLSAARLSSIDIPESVRFLTIFADAGEVGWTEAVKAQEKYEQGGYSVEIVRPAAHFSDSASDFNDILQSV